MQTLTQYFVIFLNIFLCCNLYIEISIYIRKSFVNVNTYKTFIKIKYLISKFFFFIFDV